MASDSSTAAATLPNSETPIVPLAGKEGTQSSTKERHSNIVIHHLNNSRSQRILWLLEELELPYTLKHYTRNEEMRAPKELKDVHSLGKAPILTDGEVTIAESGAIIQYIISQYGAKLRPTETGKIDDFYFSHYAEGTLMPILINKLIFSLIPQRAPALIRILLKPVFATLEKKLLDPELEANCALVESHLEKSKTGWLTDADHPTAADFMMMFPAEILALHVPSAGPKTKEYVDRIHDRPAWRRGLEKGGEYEYAKL